MAHPRIEYAVLPAGDGPGQDRCFTADGLVVVLDGASAYDPSVSPDASEYVDALGSALQARISCEPRINLRNALADAIREVTKKLAVIAGKGPSATVSIARWGAQSMDVLVLGDSPIVVQLADGTHHTFVQHAMKHIAPELRRRYRERLVAGSGYDHEHRAILGEIQRHEAPRRNRSGGYFIAEADPAAANYCISRQWPLHAVSAAIAGTDGFATPLEQLGLTFEQIVPMNSEDLFGLLKQLHEWEERVDPDGRLLPRSKVHDDKAVAVLRPDHLDQR